MEQLSSALEKGKNYLPSLRTENATQNVSGLTKTFHRPWIDIFSVLRIEKGFFVLCNSKFLRTDKEFSQQALD